MKKLINIFLTFVVVSSCSSGDVVDNYADTELSCIEKIAKYSDIVSAQAINYNNVDGSTELHVV